MNREYLALFKKGVHAWNKWRRRNPDIRPDLGGWNLCSESLDHANLSYANLCLANLDEAYLIYANLSHTDLTGADLRNANLTGANLSGADLGGANLSGAKVENADLRYGRLCRCNLTEATLTGCRLYGTARDEWIIKGIQCGYVFWDLKGKIRSPRDRDLGPGEFEQLYRALPTIEYVFQNGMSPLDPLIMDRVVQAIREQYPQFDIKIDSINARGLAPSLKFTVQQEEHKEPALAEVTRVYEAKVHELAGRLDEARDFIQQLISHPMSVRITHATGQYLAIDGSTINIEQHIHNAVELQKVIAEQPADSPTFAKVAKKTALDVIGSALKDVAKGQVKKAAEQIIELAKDLGPVVVNTAAYAFFKNCLS